VELRQRGIRDRGTDTQQLDENILHILVVDEVSTLLRFVGEKANRVIGDRNGVRESQTSTRQGVTEPPEFSSSPVANT
jgi:acyl-[acyl carrier protein]--UDP-N-acetylglucosamine O-acyltransferase